jgi:hypothetical protein
MKHTQHNGMLCCVCFGPHEREPANKRVVCQTTQTPFS